MNFNEHYDLVGKHAFLSPSQYHWVNYNSEKLINVYKNMRAKQLGTEYHETAAKLIKFGWKMPRNHKTINWYVNDAIGYMMTPEQPLYYSSNCFGTADAISFDEKILRIHDLKTGSTPANMTQLKIYAAIFCLEYNYKPHKIQIELRIYQNDDRIILQPDPEEIQIIMDLIVNFDSMINEFKESERGDSYV